MTPEQALISIYQRAARRLRAQIQQAMKSGNLGTAIYRQRQLDAVYRELRALGTRTRRLSIDVVADAYVRSVTAVDASVGRSTAEIAFSATHPRTAAIIADNLSARLDDAIEIVGRRTDDAFRRIALEEVGRGVAAGEERRLVSAAIERRLVDEGVTDALTGFVDRAGRRWQLDVYARMVARTTTREAVSAGTHARMAQLGSDLVTISDHSTTTEICQAYEGKTFSLTGATAGFDVLDQEPPFHPNCLHVMTPAEGNFDEYIATLEAAPDEAALDAILGIAA